MIEHYDFGEIIIDGNSYEDIKIINSRVIPWHQIEHHRVTMQDLDEIIASKPAIIVIGTGYSGMMHVKDDVMDFAKNHKIKLIIENTRNAVGVFNDLEKKGENVAAIMHATC